MSILEELSFTVYHEGKLHAITALPYLFPAKDGVPASFDAKLDGKSIGDINCIEEKWENENIKDTELLRKIGNLIISKYI